MKNFVVVGVGGYIAARHLEAINDSGNRIIAAMDVNDSVGILDRYTQDVAFYTDFDKFESLIKSLKGTDKQIDYLSICSPNYLHCSHIKFGLENGCDVICEKPLVLFENEIDELKEFETKFNKKVYTVLQLREHNAIISLRNKILKSSRSVHEVDLTYITSRGPWYHESWKGDTEKSGGLASNIGIHFFDMLTWVFGSVSKNEIHVSNNFIASGYMELEKAKVKWVLSVDRKYLPQIARDSGKTTYRSILIDGDEIEFSGGFTDLHTKVYNQTTSGHGYGLEDAREAIRIVDQLKRSTVLGQQPYSHPILKEFK